MRVLKFDLEKTNLLGSGISIGHSVGFTGARIMLSLARQMVRSSLEFGLANLCIGSGHGMAMVLERL